MCRPCQEPPPHPHILADTSAESSIPGANPLSKFFRHLGARSDFFLSLLVLDYFQLEIIQMPKRHSGVAPAELSQIVFARC